MSCNGQYLVGKSVLSTWSLFPREPTVEAETGAMEVIYMG